MDIIRKIELENQRMDLPAFRSGDTVKVHLRIVEGEKERIQVFQGNVIRIKRGTTSATFTVRKVSDGVGVERIFPIHSPRIERIEVLKNGKVRRAKLNYLKSLSGKAARLQEKTKIIPGADTVKEVVTEETAAPVNPEAAAETK